MKKFLVNLQTELKIFIAIEDAFPKTTDFEDIVRDLFDDKAQVLIQGVQ